MCYKKRPMSGAFVSFYGSSALNIYGGSSDDGLAKDAPALLFKYIFSRCRELGSEEFNLGGVPAEAVNTCIESHGLYRFKLGYGGQERQCKSLLIDNLNTYRESTLK